MAIKPVLKMIHFNTIIESMRHFLGSIRVFGYVRGPIFTRHLGVITLTPLAFTLSGQSYDSKNYFFKIYTLYIPQIAGVLILVIFLLKTC